MAYTREKIDTDIEREIIIGLIVSTDYLTDVAKMIKLPHFTVRYYRRIAKWVIDYFDQYHKAPFDDIRKIFAVEGPKLPDDEVDLISNLLDDISDEYIEQEAAGKFNPRYLYDKTLLFCKKRNLEILVDTIDGQLVKNRIDKAEEALGAFSQVQNETSRWINPLEKKEVERLMRESSEDHLFSLPGVLGDLTGPLQRDWLVAWMGPPKRGKSWYLQEMAFEALAAGLKVVYVSLEMSEKNVAKRIYSRLTARSKRDQEIVYPVFDCVSNQDGTCLKDECVNDIALPPLTDGDTYRTVFGRYKEYKPCTVCRAQRSPDYAPAIWYVKYDVKKIDTQMVVKKGKDFKKLFGDNLRIISYPPFGANFSQIIRDIDDLKRLQNFKGDLIAIDYFDIMGKDEERYQSERGEINARWMRGKNYAATEHSLMATVTQTNRGSSAKDDLTPDDVSEEWRKLAHVDLIYGINQTGDEKFEGSTRISVVAFRHDDFNMLGQVTTLQNFFIGQPIIDCEYTAKWYRKLYGGKTKKRPKERSAQQPSSSGEGEKKKRVYTINRRQS